MRISELPRRVIKRYTCHSFGFPVILSNVTIAGRGKYAIPLINYKAVEKRIIQSLPGKRARLTGSEVRFIRKHFEMTMADFGVRLGVSHVAVKKWEDRRDEPTGMTWSTEKDIRMFVKRTLGSADTEFVALYDQLRLPLPAKKEAAIRISVPSRVPTSRIHSA